MVVAVLMVVFNVLALMALMNTARNSGLPVYGEASEDRVPADGRIGSVPGAGKRKEERRTAKCRRLGTKRRRGRIRSCMHGEYLFEIYDRIDSIMKEMLVLSDNLRRVSRTLSCVVAEPQNGVHLSPDKSLDADTDMLKENLSVKPGSLEEEASSCSAKDGVDKSHKGKHVNDVIETRTRKSVFASEKLSDGSHPVKAPEPWSPCTTKTGTGLLRSVALEHLRNFKWDGTKTFSSWLRRYSDLADLERWDEKKKSVSIWHFLPEKIGIIRDTLQEADKRNFSMVVQKVKRFYEDTIPLGGAEQQLTRCWQGKAETVSSFASRLKGLVCMATLGQEDSFCRERFLKEFTSRLRPDLITLIGKTKPMQHDKAVTSALYFEALLRRGSVVSTAESYEKLCHRDAPIDRRSSPKGRSLNVPNVHDKVVCYHCRNFGHLRIACPHRNVPRIRKTTQFKMYACSGNAARWTHEDFQHLRMRAGKMLEKYPALLQTK